MVVMFYENIAGANQFRYRIGFNSRVAASSWGRCLASGVDDDAQGSGVALGRSAASGARKETRRAVDEKRPCGALKPVGRSYFAEVLGFTFEFVSLAQIHECLARR
jgi:hypothetical protein